MKCSNFELEKGRTGECNFNSGRWCGYEQDPDDDFDWKLTHADNYAVILLNEHEKLQYARLQSPFIHAKVPHIFNPKKS